MEKNNVLEQIANGLYAVSRINNLYNSAFRSGTNPAVRAGGKPMLAEIIKTIAEFSPENQKRRMSIALNNSYNYSEAYRNMKQHLRYSRNRSVDREFLIKSFEIVKPMLSNERKVLVDKITKIYEIIKHT